MVTLLIFMKSIHNIKVSSFFFKKRNEVPQGDILGHIYPVLKNYSSCTCNSFSSSIPIIYVVLETGEAPCTKSIEKSMSLFGGNPGIYLKKYSKYLNTRWSLMLSTLYSSFSNSHNSWNGLNISLLPFLTKTCDCLAVIV
jgi:hypothetical protein